MLRAESATPFLLVVRRRLQFPADRRVTFVYRRITVVLIVLILTLAQQRYAIGVELLRILTKCWVVPLAACLQSRHCFYDVYVAR